MKIVVLGPATPIGRALVGTLRRRRPSPSIVALSSDAPGDGAFDEAFAGADVVVDIADATRLAAGAEVHAAIAASAEGVASAAERARVGHLVFVSSTGVGRRSESEHFSARLAAESVVEASGVPSTVIRTTQLFEAVRDLSRTRPHGDLVSSRVVIQPVAARDVAGVVADVAGGAPRGGVVALAGPECFHLGELLERVRLMQFFHRESWMGTPRTAPAEGSAAATLLRNGRAEVTPTRFAEWVASRSVPVGTA